MRRRIFLLILCLTGMIFSLSAQTIYYVALDGKDKSKGTEKATLRSIEKAKSLARETCGEVTICLREGEYRLEKTFVFTPEDGNGDKRLTICSYPGERSAIGMDSERGVYIVTHLGFDSRLRDFLQANDVILKFGGKAVNNLDDLDTAIKQSDLAKPVEMVIFRHQKGNMVIIPGNTI